MLNSLSAIIQNPVKGIRFADKSNQISLQISHKYLSPVQLDWVLVWLRVRSLSNMKLYGHEKLDAFVFKATFLFSWGPKKSIWKQRNTESCQHFYGDGKPRLDSSSATSSSGGKTFCCCSVYIYIYILGIVFICYAPNL